MVGQLELLAYFRETSELLVLRLGHAVLDESRNPEDVAARGGLVVLELPVVGSEVLPVVVAEARRGRVLTQRVARLHLPENGAVVAQLPSEVAPLGGEVRELRNRTVGDVREERVLDDLPQQLSHASLEPARVVLNGQMLLVGQLEYLRHDTTKRSLAVHDCLSPKMGGSPTKMAREGVEVPNL